MLPRLSKLPDMFDLPLKSTMAVESESTEVAESAGEKGLGELLRELGEA